MTDDEVGDRLLEMREATARRCVEIAENLKNARFAPSFGRANGSFVAGCIISAIKKEFGLEE